MRTRCGSQTPTDLSPPVGRVSGRVVEDVPAGEQVGVGLGERDGDGCVAAAAAGVPVEVAPGARGDQPPSAVADQVGGVVAVHARAARPPEEQVGAVLRKPALGVQRPDARVGGVEEAGPGRGRGEEQSPAVAHGRAVGLAHEPDVAQAELTERARADVPDEALGAEMESPAEALVAGVHPLAQVVPRSRPPAAALACEPGQVRPGQAEGQRLGWQVEPAETAAAVVRGAPGGRHVEVQHVVVQPHGHGRRATGERERGGTGRRGDRGGVRRGLGQRPLSRTVRGHRGEGRGDQVDGTPSGDDLERPQARQPQHAGQCGSPRWVASSAA